MVAEWFCLLVGSNRRTLAKDDKRLKRVLANCDSNGCSLARPSCAGRLYWHSPPQSHFLGGNPLRPFPVGDRNSRAARRAASSWAIRRTRNQQPAAVFDVLNPRGRPSTPTPRLPSFGIYILWRQLRRRRACLSSLGARPAGLRGFRRRCLAHVSSRQFDFPLPSRKAARVRLALRLPQQVHPALSFRLSLDKLQAQPFYRRFSKIQGLGRRFAFRYPIEITIHTTSR